MEVCKQQGHSFNKNSCGFSHARSCDKSWNSSEQGHSIPFSSVSDRRTDQVSLTEKVTATCQPGAKPRIGKRFGALLDVS